MSQWLVRRRWFGGRFAAESAETLCALARSGFLRSTDKVCPPNLPFDKSENWKEARFVPELAANVRELGPGVFSPRVRRLATYVLSSLIGGAVGVGVASAFASIASENRRMLAAAVLLLVYVLHVVRRIELSISTARFDDASRFSVLLHRAKDGRDPTRDECLLELSYINHLLDARVTLFEIHTVIELAIVGIVVFFAL